MPVVISLLRGVNLGSHNKVSMDALRALYESLKLQNPQTYVQSGNVVFKTTERDLPRLATRLENAIERAFGFRTPVILRTSSELKDVVARNPFAARRSLDPKRFLVTFLADHPPKDARDKVLALKAAPEELHLLGREIYFYYPNGLARPKLSWVSVEKMLKTPGTSRNWNTVTKLLGLADTL
jgi:uncharacterized protein (DUF1697 family)